MFLPVRARGFRLAIAALLVAAGCTPQQSPEGEENGSPADAPEIGRLEPRHGGFFVELSGEYDAEFVLGAGGMCFVYLYDADGNPVPYQGKDVKVVVTATDGQREEIALEGMGAGAGAHFMNPLSEGLMEKIEAEGGFVAEITVTAPEGVQTGHLEVASGEL